MFIWCRLQQQLVSLEHTLYPRLNCLVIKLGWTQRFIWVLWMIWPLGSFLKREQSTSRLMKLTSFSKSELQGLRDIRPFWVTHQTITVISAHASIWNVLVTFETRLSFGIRPIIGPEMRSKFLVKCFKLGSKRNLQQKLGRLTMNFENFAFSNFNFKL